MERHCVGNGEHGPGSWQRLWGCAPCRLTLSTCVAIVCMHHKDRALQVEVVACPKSSSKGQSN